MVWRLRPLHTRCVFMCKLFAHTQLTADWAEVWVNTSSIRNCCAEWTPCHLRYSSINNNGRWAPHLCLSAPRASCNIRQSIADQLDYLLYCLHRWHLELSTCPSKMHPESVVFQLFCEDSLSLYPTPQVFCQFDFLRFCYKPKTVGSKLLMWTFPSGLFLLHTVCQCVSFCWTMAHLPIPTLQYCGVLLNRARATHRFKRRSWSDEVQNQFVSIPLHSGWNVSTHLS